MVIMLDMKKYRTKLKGMSSQEIEEEIRVRKKEITDLKKDVEFRILHPGVEMYPDPSFTLLLRQSELTCAIAAYEKTGETYQRDEIEQRAVEFDAVIPKMTKIVLSIDRLGKHSIRTITFVGEHIKLQMEPRSYKPFFYNNDLEYRDGKKVFFKVFRDVHMGEWDRYYNGQEAKNETQWEVTIEYKDGQTIKFVGKDAYPFSFELFCPLVGYDGKFYE